MADHFIPDGMDPIVAETADAADPVMYAFMFDPDRAGSSRATVLAADGVYMYARAAGFDFLEHEWEFDMGRGGRATRFARNLNRPKLPLAAFATAFDFYRTAARTMHDTEAQMTFWWANTPELKASAPKDETVVWWTDDVFSYVPRQRNTQASSSVGDDPVYRDLVARYPILAETHSHDSMGAFMSETDRRNSDVPCFQMVFGRVGTARPQFNAWLALDNRHIFEDMSADEAFGFIEKVPLLGPAKAVSAKTAVVAPAPAKRPVSAKPIVEAEAPAEPAPAKDGPAPATPQASVPQRPHEGMSLYESLLMDLTALVDASDYYTPNLPDPTVDADVANVVRDNAKNWAAGEVDRSTPTWYPDLIADALDTIQGDLDDEFDPVIWGDEGLDDIDDGWGGYAYAGGVTYPTAYSRAYPRTSYAVGEDVTGVIDPDELLKHSRFAEFSKTWLARIRGGVERRVAGVVREVAPAIPADTAEASSAVPSVAPVSTFGLWSGVGRTRRTRR